MRRRTVALAICLAVLAGACTTRHDFDERPFEQELVISRGYQSVYASALRGMRKCLQPGSVAITGTAANVLEADLYPDLNYGEITYYLSGVASLYYFSTRIEPVGDKARIKVKTGSGSDGARSNTREWVFYWARGGTSCQKVGQLRPPAR